MKRIVLTKALSSFQRGLLTQSGIDPLECSVLSVQDWFDSDAVRRNIQSPDFNLWVFTSKNAVRALRKITDTGPRFVPPLDVAAIEPQTSKRLRSIGIHANITGTDAEQLVSKIKDHSQAQKALYFAGERNTGLIQTGLALAGIEFQVMTMYRTVPLYPKLESTAYEGIIFFSPAGVDSFMTRNQLNGQKVFAIGKTTAHHLSDVYGKEAIYPSVPDLKEIVHLINQNL